MSPFSSFGRTVSQKAVESNTTSLGVRQNVRQTQTHCDPAHKIMLYEYSLYRSQYLAKDQLVCFKGTVQTHVVMALAVGFL